MAHKSYYTFFDSDFINYMFSWRWHIIVVTTSFSQNILRLQFKELPKHLLLLHHYVLVRTHSSLISQLEPMVLLDGLRCQTLQDQTSSPLKMIISSNCNSTIERVTLLLTPPKDRYLEKSLLTIFVLQFQRVTCHIVWPGGWSGRLRAHLVGPRDSAAGDRVRHGRDLHWRQQICRRVRARVRIHHGWSDHPGASGQH